MTADDTTSSVEKDRPFHTETDPACVFHREPATWWQRRKFDRARGRACAMCRIVYPVTRQHLPPDKPAAGES